MDRLRSPTYAKLPEGVSERERPFSAILDVLASRVQVSSVGAFMAKPGTRRPQQAKKWPSPPVGQLNPHPCPPVLRLIVYSTAIRETHNPPHFIVAPRVAIPQMGFMQRNCVLLCRHFPQVIRSVVDSFPHHVSSSHGRVCHSSHYREGSGAPGC